MPLRALITTIKTGGLFLSAVSFGILEIHFLPAPGKILVLAIAMLVDLWTGLLKAWKEGDITRSRGFKRTAIKFGTYASIIVAVSLMANVLADIAPSVSEYYNHIVTGTVGFLTFVEIYSIFENVYEQDKESFLSRKFIGPVLIWMKGIADKHHPFKRAQDDAGEYTTDETEATAAEECRDT